MGKKVTQEEILLIDELIRAGIPLDPEVLRTMKAAPQGLKIHSVDDFIANQLFDLDHGRTGFILSVAIENESSQSICPCECRLQLPWFDPGFSWLEDPWEKEPREDDYAFPPPEKCPFPRSEVLNHRLCRGVKLSPRNSMDGLLLGVGQAPIPEAYADRLRLEMELSILDQLGNVYWTMVKLVVRRDAQWKRRHPEASGQVAQGLGRRVKSLA